MKGEGDDREQHEPAGVLRGVSMASVTEALRVNLPALASAGTSLSESTSAALRRVEQERDQLRDELSGFRTALTLTTTSRNRNRERALKAEAELVSARTELDAVRTARDNLDRELAEARALLAKDLINGLDYALKQMDDHIRTADGWLATSRPGLAASLITLAARLGRCRSAWPSPHRTEEHETA